MCSSGQPWFSAPPDRCVFTWTPKTTTSRTPCATILESWWGRGEGVCKIAYGYLIAARWQCPHRGARVPHAECHAAHERLANQRDRAAAGLGVRIVADPLASGERDAGARHALGLYGSGKEELNDERRHALVAGA